MSLTITEVSDISFAGSLTANLLSVLHNAADRYAQTTENICEATRALNLQALKIQNSASSASDAARVGTAQCGKVQLS